MHTGFSVIVKALGAQKTDNRLNLVRPILIRLTRIGVDNQVGTDTLAQYVSQLAEAVSIRHTVCDILRVVNVVCEFVKLTDRQVHFDNHGSISSNGTAIAGRTTQS